MSLPPTTSLTEDTKAILLLCGVLGREHAADPLTQTEYNALARWLFDRKMRPADLLEGKNTAFAAAGAGIREKRLHALLGRGVLLGFAVEEWQRNGIWILSRSDPDYPRRYKKHLGDKAPSLLFGVGDRSLLQGGGLAIVGSRNVDAEGEAFARRVAILCVHNKMPVISGGARGVDHIAMTAALEAGGVALGILADNLLKKALDRETRNAIFQGGLLLISPYHPNARFTAGAAMGRNKLIHALADHALVVSAEYKKGGSWRGAVEELGRENPRAVFVRVDQDAPPGNRKLLDLGARPWPAPESPETLSRQLAALAAESERGGELAVSQMDLPLEIGN
uniref:Predicted Rossmann fold nucleotide-binding protein DprA/Smf involved in DNA uptake n=1 Tax=Candidatus Kentrum sp. FW TaxID=2126338 RepID=A0A450SSW3_9GAMM|nr:MAG: Predicted Rossmann fold nucleotide-binding protein DprA/Smf involved in DNA uptake [Candidatus Kentron sp. FW]